MDKATKWGYFILYIEEITAKDLSEIYVREVFIRYRILGKIISDRDPKFILGF